MDVKAVVFDLDDTLCWERDYIASGFRAVAEVDADPERAFAFLWGEFEAGHRGNQFDRFLAAHPEVAERYTVADLVERYRGHPPTYRLSDEWVHLLESLRRTRRLGVITDGPLASQMAKARALELADLVDAVVFSDQRGRDGWKPSPLPYQDAEAALGTSPEQMVYVGDNPLKDFVTARARGWHTIRLRHPNQLRHALDAPDASHAADVTVASVYDLSRLLLDEQ